jgi:hypothetical protein
MNRKAELVAVDNYQLTCLMFMLLILNYSKNEDNDVINVE